jgi:hypothetical protein
MLSRGRITGVIYLLLFLHITALDIGGAIKNLVKNPELPNVEASTGTIVSRPTDTDKKTVSVNSASCDELLAQAVVRSNEQKLAAISERDAALITAANATLVANDCLRELDKGQIKLSESAERIQILEEQFHQLQSDTLKQIERIQQEAQASIHSTLEQSQRDIQSIKNETRNQVEKITAQYQDELGTVKREAEEEVSRIRLDADERITKIQQETDDFISKFNTTTLNEKQMIQEESSQLVQDIRQQMEKLVMETNTSLTQCLVKSQETELQLRTNMDAFKEQAEKNMRKLASIWKAKRNRAHVIASGAMAKLREEKEKEIEASRFSSEEEIQRISTALNNRLDEQIAIVTEVQVAKDTLEKELLKAQEINIANRETIDQSLARIESLELQLVQSNDLSSKLLSQIQSFDALLKEKDAIIDIWESKPKMYVNVTMLKEDFFFFWGLLTAQTRGVTAKAYDILRKTNKHIASRLPVLKESLQSKMYSIYNFCSFQYRQILEQYPKWIAPLKEVLNSETINKVKNQITLFVSKIYDVMEPYLEHAIMVYKTRVSPIVDSIYFTGKELYTRRILPVMTRTESIVMKYAVLSQEKYQKIRSDCIQKIIATADVIIQRVSLLEKRHDDTKLWVIILETIQNIRRNASFYFDAIAILSLILLITRRRIFLFRLMKRIMRVLWFLFPFRFMFRSSKRCDSGRKFSLTNGTAGANGHAMLVVGGTSKHS